MLSAEYFFYFSRHKSIMVITNLFNMKSNSKLFKVVFILVLSLLVNNSFGNNPSTPVEKYGQLKIDGTTIVGKDNQIVQLTGMSLFWSQWIGKYFNHDCIEWLANDWKCTIVRAAMGVNYGGYAKHPKREQKKIEKVVDAAIDQGIYVIIDFHEHNAENFLPEAKTFFAAMAQKYGKYPNVIYEIYNEPLQVSWSGVIKPYCEEVIKVIRQYDPDNIIICGTSSWSQNVDEAALDPISDKNVAYALHFYSGTHKQWLIDKAEIAMNKGLCLFVSEWGTTDANGDGPVYLAETKMWFNWMDKHHISHCNWSVADKKESSSALTKGASAHGRWKESQIKPSGLLVKSEFAKKYAEMFK
jgi:endoglucanase